MLVMRPAGERGRFQNEWLDSCHTFSFGHYYDAKYMNFRALRVINEDRVAPSGGFAEHGHQDMDIITYVIAGELEHKDSLGNGSIIRHGEAQRMSAGTGIRHSEYNPSLVNPVHFLQIWIQPNTKGLPPSYEQRNFVLQPQSLTLLASQDKRGVVHVHQDVDLYAGLLQANQRLEYEIALQRYVWLQIVTGTLHVNAQVLSAGDGVAVSQESSIQLSAQTDCEFLLFDLA